MLRATGIASIGARRLLPSQYAAHRFLSSLSTKESDTSIERFEPANWFPDVKNTSVRAELNKIREKENEIFSLIERQSEPIDWNKWSKEISYPGLVDELKQSFDSISIPDAKEQTKLAEAQIEEMFEPMLEKFEAITAEATKQAESLEKEIAETKFVRDNIEELTVDEFLERFPTIKKSIEKDIENNKWFVSES